MTICRKYISIFVVELVVFLLLSTNAFTETSFHILPNNLSQTVECDFLEIESNKALCTENNLLITYDIAYIKHIEVVHNGKARRYLIFTQETIDKINELNSYKLVAEKIIEKEDNKKKIVDSISDSALFLINIVNNQSSNNILNIILVILGLIIFLIGNVWFLIATFRAGILWGLSCMFLPFVSFVFLFIHWKTAAKPFLILILGIAILFLSTMFSPTAGTGRGISRFNSDTNHANTNSNNAAFQCSGKIYCSEMSSCAEAKYYLRNCPGTKMDGNNDGIPCEKQWCGN